MRSFSLAVRSPAAAGFTTLTSLMILVTRASVSGPAKDEFRPIRAPNRQRKTTFQCINHRNEQSTCPWRHFRGSSWLKTDAQPQAAAAVENLVFEDRLVRLVERHGQRT